VVNFLMRLPEVRRRTSLSRTEIYVRIKQGRFPLPVKLGARSVAWPADEVDMWVLEQKNKPRKVAA